MRSSCANNTITSHWQWLHSDRSATLEPITTIHQINRITRRVQTWDLEFYIYIMSYHLTLLCILYCDRSHITPYRHHNTSLWWLIFYLTFIYLHLYAVVVMHLESTEKMNNALFEIVNKDHKQTKLHEITSMVLTALSTTTLPICYVLSTINIIVSLLAHWFIPHLTGTESSADHWQIYQLNS